MGVVHAWVGQIVLVCNESKTKSVRPTEARVPNHNHGWRGHGCTWLAVLKHGGTLGACFKTLLQLRRPCLQRREWFGTDQQTSEVDPFCVGWLSRSSGDAIFEAVAVAVLFV